MSALELAPVGGLVACTPWGGERLSVMGVPHGACETAGGGDRETENVHVGVYTCTSMKMYVHAHACVRESCEIHRAVLFALLVSPSPINNHASSSKNPA
jgi:hypothetical protein